MSRKTFSVDWNAELAKLSPYLSGEGGFVRITYDGDRCAPRAFSEILKMRYENKPDNQIWRSIRIKREWHSTRFLANILNEFSRKLGYHGDGPAEDRDNRNDLKILSGNEFGGDAHINVDLTINGDQGLSLPAQRDRKVNTICEELLHFLSDGGHMMVVLRHAPINEQSDFWDFLWQRGLSTLTESGLFFVHMLDRSDDGRGDFDEMAFTNQIVNLPICLDDDRQDEAYDDLLEVFIKEIPGIPIDLASGAAISHINAFSGNIEEMHNQLPWLITKLGQRHARQSTQ